MTKFLKSPPARGAWIETLVTSTVSIIFWSPPARGAWIETPGRSPPPHAPWVAPRTGGVDRNCLRAARRPHHARRPPHGGRGSKLSASTMAARLERSPPARGAWIETAALARHAGQPFVAPRTGGVDRNPFSRGTHINLNVAPRTGGVDRNFAAWRDRRVTQVAPRTGGVDRNFLAAPRWQASLCRPPHGGRGSKLKARRAK